MINVCKAWDDHKLSGKREGLVEGRVEGRIETTIDFVRKLNNYGMEAKEIVAALKISKEQVMELLQESVKA